MLFCPILCVIAPNIRLFLLLFSSLWLLTLSLNLWSLYLWGGICSGLFTIELRVMGALSLKFFIGR
jgi:hypothetical protein